VGQAGGKAVALAALQRAGLVVPGGLCVFTGAYDRFLDFAGLRPAITLELGRKRFEDMRWEEVWDASLRIRNLFLRASLEPLLAKALEDALRRRFGDGRPAVVRSSAPAEDTAATSFAGLHESYVNVKGVPALLEAVRQVWVFRPLVTSPPPRRPSERPHAVAFRIVLHLGQSQRLQHRGHIVGEAAAQPLLLPVPTAHRVLR